MTDNNINIAEAFYGQNVPDKSGHFGEYGGKFVPETLMPALEQLEKEYLIAKEDPKFNEELKYYLNEYVGRPSPLYYARRLTEKLNGPKYILREKI